MSTLPKTDVVIVGLGAAGGIAAYVLAKAGKKVVGLEAGPYLNPDDFVAELDEIGGWGIRNRLGAVKVNQEVPTWRPTADDEVQPTPIPPFLMANGVGGSSVHYTTQSWRYREEDFKIRSGTIEKYGEAALPEGSALADWPLEYADLENYYEQVEYLIGVSGLGGGNFFEAPRERDYPLPPLRKRGFPDEAAEAMTRLGYHPFDGPAAIISEDYNGRPACTYCGFCTGFGCWNSAKSSTLVTAIPEAEATGNFEVRANSRVVKLLSDDTGKMTGVQYVDENGEMQEQPAGVVIVASYVYENSRLLLLSTSDFFPDGLANNGGQVGKYYIAHAYASANGLFPGESLNLFSGSGAQGISMDDFNGDNFDHTDLGFIRGALISCGSESLPIGQARTLPPGTPQWGSAYKEFLNTSAQTIGSVSAQVEILPYEGNFIDLDPEVTDPYGMPVVRLTFSHGEDDDKRGAFITEKLEGVLKEMGATETWSFPLGTFPINTHAYGGTRMGDDPAASVVDKNSVAHESPNLVVLGGSTFPNTTGYNPTETIQALAWLAAENIATNFDTMAQ